MTKRTEVKRIGPVVIEKIEAEVLPTPVKYAFDCEKCGSGMLASESQMVAEREAANHLDRYHDDSYIVGEETGDTP